MLITVVGKVVGTTSNDETIGQAYIETYWRPNWQRWRSQDKLLLAAAYDHCC